MLVVGCLPPVEGFQQRFPDILEFPVGEPCLTGVQVRGGGVFDGLQIVIKFR